MVSMLVRRGEVFFVELGPTRGRELDSKRRPVVVVSSDAINAKPLVITVIPGKTYRPGKQVFLNEVQVEASCINGLQSSTVFQCFQIKALDHSRFDRGPAGVLAGEDVSLIEEAIRLCLGLT